MQRKLCTPALLIRRDPHAEVHYGYGWVWSMQTGYRLEARHSPQPFAP